VRVSKWDARVYDVFLAASGETNAVMLTSDTAIGQVQTPVPGTLRRQQRTHQRSSRRLPDFLGLGALKGGTTYLDGLLRSHPELGLPAAVKEVEFFSRHYERGPDWYASFFAGCTSRRAGEISPQYLAYGPCPARIHSLLPEALLLVSLRDPVQRAYSQYKHWVQGTGYGGGFDRFLDDHPGAIERGRYFAHLSRYLDLFPSERLHVVVFEDLVSRPAEVMQGVFGFLGVDDGHVPPALPAANVSMRPRFHRPYVQAKRASRWLRSRGGGRLVDWAKRAGAVQMFGTADGFDPLSPTAAARLRDAYRDDVARLSELLGRDLLATWTSLTST
jgi:Sulfotransferase domain